MDPAENKQSQEDSSTPTTDQELSSLKQIRTFQGDVADAIGEQKESLFSIQRAEKQKMAATGQRVSAPEEKENHTLKTVLLIIGSVVLLVGGLLGGWFAYNEYVKQTTPPVISIPANRLISAGSTIEIDDTNLSRSQIINLVVEESTGVPPGQIVHLNIPLSTRVFLERLEARPPGNLIRALDELFMLGALGREGAEPSVFVLTRLSSFENAFAGMMAWEPRMVEEIGGLFATRRFVNDLPTRTAEFTDALIRNRHIRIIRNEDGQTLLLYAFFDTRMLVITDNEETLNIIMNRLASELLSR